MTINVLYCVISGSYHREINKLQSLYNELVTNGCQVISPHRISFNSSEEFVRDSEELGTSEEIIEQHHLMGIRQSNLVWLHAPGGYIGSSASFEVGYALAHNKPIFCKEILQERSLSQFVHTVSSVYEAVEKIYDPS